MSVQPDEAAPSRLDSSCQRCQAAVTLTDVHKVSEQHRRDFDGAERDGVGPGALQAPSCQTCPRRGSLPTCATGSSQNSGMREGPWTHARACMWHFCSALFKLNPSKRVDCRP